MRPCLGRCGGKGQSCLLAGIEQGPVGAGLCRAEHGVCREHAGAGQTLQGAHQVSVAAQFTTPQSDLAYLPLRQQLGTAFQNLGVDQRAADEECIPLSVRHNVQPVNGASAHMLSDL